MKNKLLRVAVRTSLIYWLVSVVWILFSDRAMISISSSPAVISKLSIYKGWGFVTVTAILLYILLRNQLSRWQAETEKRREVEKALSRYELLANHTRDLILFVRKDDGRIIEANAASIAAYGYTRNELLALSITDVRAPGQREQAVAQMAEADRGGILFETIHMRKDGSTFPVEVNSQGINIDGTRILVSVIRDITQRRDAELKLKRDEQVLRLLIENSPAAIAMFDRDMKYIVASRRYLIDYRLSEQDLVGRSHYEVFPEITERWKEIHRRCLEGKTERCDEDSFPRGDGTMDWVKWELRPWYEEAGHVGGLILFSEVITERKRAEEQLLIKNSAIETSISAIGLADLTGRIFYVNGAFVKLWGYDNTGQVLGKSITEFSDSLEKVQHAVTLMQSGNGYSGEDKGNRKDGTTFDFQISANFVKSEHGEPICIMASFIDITERKTAEERLKSTYEELKSSEEKYRSLFEQSEDAIFISKPDGSLMDVNPAGVELLGFGSKDDLLKINMIDFFVNPEEGELLLSILKRDRFAKDQEFTFKKKNGGRIVVSSTITVVLDESNQAYSYLGIIRDITKQKSLQDQLMQAQKMESVGTLAAGIAHDFNNILGIIMGYSGLIGRKELDPEKTARGTDAILKATSRGAALVKQLLTFARKAESEYESVRINDIVNEVSKLLRETLPKTIVVTEDIKPDLPPIDADATQIHQVLLNLCLNARDAMPNGGTIKISTATSESEQVGSRFPNALPIKHILLEVKDTGHGMDEETKRRIFDPFFTTKDVGKGTGLGLALVHSIVSSHNGFIEVETNPGDGTTFSIYLPIHNRKTFKDETTAITLQDAPGGAETILLIEDEEMLRDLVKAVIESKGYNVFTADDGEEGIELFTRRRSEIAVVISDLGLPKIPGDEVLRRIRSISPLVKLIAASGFIEPEVKSKLLDIGVMHFIQKPYLLAEIMQTIRETIDTKQ